MSKKEQFDQMRAALQNILDFSSCDFAKHQAAWGLGLKETIMNETTCQDFQSSKFVEDGAVEDRKGVPKCSHGMRMDEECSNCRSEIRSNPVQYREG